eukprot:jgi/Galph1/2139/GphlegSOOS_G817.1
MDKFVVRSSKTFKDAQKRKDFKTHSEQPQAPSNMKRKLVVKNKTLEKRATAKTATIRDTDKENQPLKKDTKELQEQGDINELVSQVVIWKDNTTDSYDTTSKSLKLNDLYQSHRQKSPCTESEQHNQEADLGFSSPELFQFWKRHGVPRLSQAKKKKILHSNNIQHDTNVATSQPSDMDILGHEDYGSSLLHEDDPEEFTPEIVASLEEWFQKHEKVVAYSILVLLLGNVSQPVGLTDASSEQLRVISVQINEKERTKRLELVDLECNETDTYQVNRITAVLMDQWYEMEVFPEDTVRIIFMNDEGHFQSYHCKNDSSVVLINAKQNYIILYPDILVSVTCLSSSFGCMRRSVISDWNRFSRVDSISALEGSMIHNLFESVVLQLLKDNNVLTNKNTTELFSAISFNLKESVDDILESQIESLYALSIDDHSERSLLHSLIPNIMSWAEKAIQSRCQGCDMYCYGMGNKKRCNVHILKAEGVEESIWSPIWGLKGKIDAIVNIAVEQKGTECVPLELKTIGYRNASTPSVAHLAQLLLYSLLLSERNDECCHKGILSYFVRNDEHMKHSSYIPPQQREIGILISGLRSELIGILVARNKLVRYNVIHEPKDSFFPSFTGIASSCMMLHKLLEDGTEESTRDRCGTQMFLENTSHLCEKHARYFKHWFQVIATEERHVERQRQEIWTMSAKEREQRGHCFCGVILTPIEDNHTTGLFGYSKGRWKHVFQRGQENKTFLGTHIVIGDYVVVSAKISEKKWKFGLSRGFVTNLSESFILLELDACLYDWLRTLCNDNKQYIEWRIDKEEMASGWAVVKANLQYLFLSEEQGGDTKTRRLVVELERPLFDRQIHYDFTIDAFHHLNAEQQAAVTCVFQSKDYTLIHGMPGTGKTAVIVAIVQVASHLGLSVLLCGHTHASVDNILLRLKERSVSFLRLGRYDLINSNLWEYCLDSPQRPKPKTVKGLTDILDNVQVVATTCMGISHVIFSKRKFDLVVIDEAGQIAEPVCVGPLRMVKQCFVLVGDHYQLPPLMRSSKWTEDAPPPSLFSKLCLEHPQTIVSLRQQFRMAEDIMKLSNELFYSNQLFCANEQVACKKLKVDAEKVTASNDPQWLKACLDPQKRVIFVDTDALPAREVRSHREDLKERKRIVFGENAHIHWNPIEGKVVLEIVRALCNIGVPLEDIGILSPYRTQCSLLRHRLGKWSEKVEVKTVDQFQGRDKPCMILSFVRSNEQHKIGSLLRDWRRLNVALTRAQCKCILVGSISTLQQGCSFFGRLIGLLYRDNQVETIPSGSLCDTLLPDDQWDQQYVTCEELLSIQARGILSCHILNHCHF